MPRRDPQPGPLPLSRRRFLQFGGAAGLSAGAAAVLQACTSPQPAAAPKPAAPAEPAAAAKPAAPATTSLLKVRYAVARGGLGDWGSFVGLDKRFFEAEGVDLEHILLGSFTDVATGIISGQIDCGIVSIPTAVAWAQQSQPGKLLCASQMATPQGSYNNWWCSAAGSPIRQPADAKGKKIHILAPNSIAQMVTRTVLRKHGIQPGEYEELGFGFPETYTAIKTGRVDIGLFIEPFYTNSNKLSRDEYGGREMQVVYTMLDAFPAGMHLAAIGVNTNWLAQNMEAGRRFVRAQLRAAQWGQDNPDELKQVIAKYAEVPHDNIKDMIPAQMSTDGKFLPGFFRQLQEFMIIEKTVGGLTEPLPDDKLAATGVLPTG
jgi:ABC-type nitrate/sulfonate/bicarbonate transport system substrate-binding protein